MEVKCLNIEIPPNQAKATVKPKVKLEVMWPFGNWRFGGLNPGRDPGLSPWPQGTDWLAKRIKSASSFCIYLNKNTEKGTKERDPPRTSNKKTATSPFLDPRLASRRANVAGRRGEVNSRRERREGREASGRRDRAPGHGGTGYASSQAVSSCYRLAHVCARAYFFGGPHQKCGFLLVSLQNRNQRIPSQKTPPVDRGGSGFVEVDIPFSLAQRTCACPYSGDGSRFWLSFKGIRKGSSKKRSSQIDLLATFGFPSI